MKTIIIFWIDDMTEWASSAEANLKIIANKHGFDIKVVSAINGESAVQQLASMHKFDLILMDRHMEPNNGEKYIEDIRFEEHLEYIPIIFYSQDTSTDLDSLVSQFKNVETIYRERLVDKIVEMFLQ